MKIEQSLILALFSLCSCLSSNDCLADPTEDGEFLNKLLTGEIHLHPDAFRNVNPEGLKNPPFVPNPVFNLEPYIVGAEVEWEPIYNENNSVERDLRILGPMEVSLSVTQMLGHGERSQPFTFGYGYKLEGILENGYLAIHFWDWCGGSGVFETLWILKYENYQVKEGRDYRTVPVFRTIGLVYLGDRYRGDFKFEGNSVAIGENSSVHEAGTYTFE